MAAIRRANTLFFNKDNKRFFNTVKYYKRGWFLIAENKRTDMCRTDFAVYEISGIDLDLHYIDSFKSLEEARTYIKEAHG